MDTTTSPLKSQETRLNVDRDVTKRLNMDSDTVEVNRKSSVPKPVLAITDGRGTDLGITNSPTSSMSSSKRAKLTLDDDTNVTSAASLEEDRQTQ